MKKWYNSFMVNVSLLLEQKYLAIALVGLAILLASPFFKSSLIGGAFFVVGFLAIASGLVLDKEDWKKMYKEAKMLYNEVVNKIKGFF